MGVTLSFVNPLINYQRFRMSPLVMFQGGGYQTLGATWLYALPARGG